MPAKTQTYVLDQDFSQKELDPALGNENPKFELRPEGRQYPNSRISFPIQPPFPRWVSVQVQIEATFQSTGAFSLSAGAVTLSHGGNQNVHASIIRGHNHGMQRASEPVRIGKRQTFTFRVEASRYELRVDNESFMLFEDPSGPDAFQEMILLIWGDPLIHRIRVKARAAPAAPRLLTARQPFQFQVTIDFPDDLIWGIPFSPSHFDSMLDHFEQWGVKRVYWMPYDRGLWEDFGISIGCHRAGYLEAVRKTFELTGDPLDYLVKKGHERGMEVYATLKPHEMGYSFLEVYPDGTKEAREWGKVKFVDGWTPGLATWLRRRPDCLIQRRPGSTQENLRDRRIRAIKLYHRRDEAIGLPADGIRIWISRNNASYSLYEGPRTITERSETRRRPRYDHCGVHFDGPEERVRVLAIEGLETDASFVVLTTPTGQGRCVNFFYALAELLDDQGRSVPFSYGFQPNPLDTAWAPDKKPLDPSYLSGVSLRFDNLNETGVFSAMAPRDRIETLCAFGQDEGLLALAKGKNPCISGAAEVAYPEVREWWLSIVRGLIAQGVDGVDFRAGSHGTTFEWKQFGFNPPIVAEFKRRHGIDILTQDFDIASWRKLRGEYYAQFLREAGAVLHAAGRKCQVHIFDFDEADPDRGNPMMNMHWDWQTWIEEGFIDEISNKGMHPEGQFWRDICRAAERRQIPIYFVPFAGTIGFNLKGWQRKFARLFDAVRESGQSGLNLYECHTLLRTQAGSSVLEVYPEGKGFTEFMREYHRSLK